MGNGAIKVNRIGQKFGRLLIIADAPTRFRENSRPTYWLCQCDCGVIKEMATQGMVHGKVISCGCYNREKAKTSSATHGLSYSKEYRCWSKVKGRCTNPSNDAYYNYGGRGIKMCDRWLNSFENFFQDMGNKPSDLHTIDRINNEGNYESNNCKWATRQEQADNRRMCVLVEHNGQTKNIAQWAKLLGITYGTLYGQIRQYGKDLGDVISERGYKLSTQ